MRLRMDIAYDGTDFHGWAKQPGLRTVQGELEHALNTVLAHRNEHGDVLAGDIHVTVAGRTDTGVHASHQVTHCDVDRARLDDAVGYVKLNSIDALAHRLRHMLPDDVALLSLTEAPRGFDARFSALERTYRYRICDELCTPDPRLRNCVLNVRGSLNVAAMDEAMQETIGLHDFGSFATANEGGTTIRKVKSAHWRRQGEASSSDDVVLSLPGMVLCTIVADAFAHNMVRSLVNASVSIGLGKRDRAWFAHKIHHPLREGSTGPIDPRGLSLESVQYPADDELSSRATSIRARRTLDDD